MNTLESFWLKKIVLYDKAEFKFTPGVTVVQAVNLNRPGRGSNYSGKSLLFTALSNAMLNTEPLITKNARSLQKDIFSTKGSEVGFKLTTPKHKYKVTKKRTKTTVIKDGKDLKLRTAALQSEYVQNLLKTNEEEFFTLRYIDSRRPSTFQFGTSASRFDFFTNLFRLGDLDETRKWLRRQVVSLKENQIITDRITQELKELGKKKDSEELQRKYDELTSELKALGKKQREVGELIHLYEMYRMYKPVKEKYESLLDTAKSDNPRKEIDQIDSRLEKLEEQREKNARIQERGERRKQLQKKLEELDVPSKFKKLSADKIKRLVHKLNKRLSELNRKYEDLKVEAPKNPCPAPKKIKRETLRLLGDVKDSKLLDEIKARISKIDGKRSSLEEESNSFEGHFGKHSSNAVCPTCAQKVDLEAIRKSIKRSKEKRESLQVEQDDLYALRHLVSDYQEHEEYEQARKSRNKIKDKIKLLKERYNVEGLDKCANLLERLEELPVKTEELFGDSKEEEKKLRKKRDLLKELMDAKRRLSDYKDVDRIEDGEGLDLEELKRKQKKLDSKLDKVQSELPKIRSDLDRVKEHNGRIKKLTKELTQVSEGLKDLPLYEAMVDAHSLQGVKMFVIRKIATMVEQNMNHYSKLLYQEPYSFELKVDTGRFDAIVTRNLGGKISPSDIRKMSGAESRIFTLLFLLSILPFIPKERRLNFLILDEPSENLDSGMMQVFKEVLLPELAKIIPSIVVISPNDLLVAPGYRQVTIVKQGATSRVVEGKYVPTHDKLRRTRKGKAAHV